MSTERSQHDDQFLAELAALDELLRKPVESVGPVEPVEPVEPVLVGPVADAEPGAPVAILELPSKYAPSWTISAPALISPAMKRWRRFIDRSYAVGVFCLRQSAP